MERKVVCKICFSDQLSVIFTKLPFRILKCSFCGVGFLYPSLDERDFKKLYSRKYFRKDLEGSGYRCYEEMKNCLGDEALRKIRYIKSKCKRLRLLDVGAGLGDFGFQARQKGFSVEVLDRSEWALSYAKRKYDLRGYVSDLSETIFTSKKFEIITAWDVIEHLSDPLGSLKVLNHLLVDSGFLFITTPNLHSLDAVIMGKKWYGFKKIPEHTFYFSPRSIQFLADSTGFKVVEIKTWGFVRSLDFVASKVKLYNKYIGILLEKFFQLSLLKDKNVYFPFIDMIVVLQKKDV